MRRKIAALVGAAILVGLVASSSASAGVSACVWQAVRGADEWSKSLSLGGPRNVWVAGMPSDWVARWDGVRWNRYALPAPMDLGPEVVLATSAREAWVFGAGFSWSGVARWQGGQFELVKTPLPPRLHVVVDMLAMDSSAPDDVWAVGAHVVRGSGHPLIEHWDGKQWTVSFTEAAAGVFNDVLALSPRDAWAVGWRHVAPAESSTPVVMHWDGVQWRRVQPPQPGMALTAISGIPGAVWGIASWGHVRYDMRGADPVRPAGDQYAFARWDGHRWTLTAAPKANRISDLAVISSTDIVAVGDTGYGHGTGIAWRWNGTQWSPQHTPSSDGWSLVDARAGAIWAIDGGRTLARCVT